ncbi:hypothetical protein JCM33374_g1959 [Metschnikowia sp. JCM 33374]|nr:hypothetical protein JCM33374_g1959 [Metschnikowia sp. JCM 33374]
MGILAILKSRGLVTDEVSILADSSMPIQRTVGKFNSVTATDASEVQVSEEEWGIDCSASSEDEGGFYDGCLKYLCVFSLLLTEAQNKTLLERSAWDIRIAFVRVPANLRKKNDLDTWPNLEGVCKRWG